MGLVLKILVLHSFFISLHDVRTLPVYDNLNLNASLGINCSETLTKLVTDVDYTVEDFTDYTQDEEEPKYAPDVPKSRHPRSIRRVLSWVGRGFNKVFNSPYIYNFYPIINYSVGKIMQHLPFLSNNPSNPSGQQNLPSSDYPQPSPSQPNPQQLQKQQQMQQEYEEEMEKKQREMQMKQEEAEAKAKHAAEEKKIINERAKKLAATYVQLYFAKETSPVLSFPTAYNQMGPANYAPGEAPYNEPAAAQAPVYNPPVYDQAYPQPNYPAAYPAVDTLAGPDPIPPVYNPAPPPVVQPVNYVNE
ncbi:hypothetical protein WDU94_009738 [Cyamophila willieti]